MIHFIEQKLSTLHSCFSRTAAYRWFVIIIVSMMLRADSLGITSFIRALCLHPRKYEPLLHFFRSSVFSTSALKKCWHNIICNYPNLHRLNGRVLILGDGTKVAKESCFMPGVKKLYQESEDSSKPQYIFGHMYGGIGTVIGNESKSFCIPLDMNIQDGLRETAAWTNGDISDSSSHVIQMIRNSHDIARTFGSSYLVLDRYFLTVPALKELDSLNKNSNCLDIITRAKTSCTAYELPPQNDSPQRGRPRKKGVAIRLNQLFAQRAADFKEAEVMMYGKKQKVEYLCLNLLWGLKLYKEVRFVLVKYNQCTAIFVSTDLTMNPLFIIEAYAHRFKIECMFREFKQQLHGFGYHFWSSKMPKLKKYKKKSEPDQLSQITDESHKKAILLTVGAIERFVLCAGIAMGIVQMIVLDPVMTKGINKHRYLRTSCDNKVSEATVMEYLRKNFFRLLSLNPHSDLNRFILSIQEPDFDEFDGQDSA